MSKFYMEGDIKTAADALHMIRGINLDYDGYRKAKDLMGIIDELNEIAATGLWRSKKKYYHTIYKNRGDDLEWYAFSESELAEFLIEKYNYKYELENDLKNNELIIIKGVKQLNFEISV